MRASRTILAAVLAVCFIMAQPARSQDDEARAGIAAAISGQLEAFVAEDASRAYGFAAPAIRRLFRDEGRFMEMVRQSYPPVYRSASHRFGTLRAEGDGFVQQVFIRDETGEEWIAVYTLERDPEGRWLIAGCRLLRRPGSSA